MRLRFPGLATIVLAAVVSDVIEFVSLIHLLKVEVIRSNHYPFSPFDPSAQRWVLKKRGGDGGIADGGQWDLQCGGNKARILFSYVFFCYECCLVI